MLITNVWTSQKYSSDTGLLGQKLLVVLPRLTLDALMGCGTTSMPPEVGGGKPGKWAWFMEGGDAEEADSGLAVWWPA